MEFGLEGKVALIAGGSKGLGFASAYALAREGANISIFSRNEEDLDIAVQKIEQLNRGKVHCVVANLRKANELQRVVYETVEMFGGLDILVNNSGGPALGTFMKVTEQDWLDALEIEVMSVVRLCRLVIPLMRKRGGGRIINITTVGVKKPQPGLVLSDASRHCINGLALNLAVEFATDNILVNTVCPGPIMTDRLKEAIETTADHNQMSLKDAEEHWLNLIPLHRFGDPQDLGDLVAFLASDRGSFITGAVIQVDGGKAVS
jgi:3-oxoacyl-[acyl-carrier protein] reductase